jgi:hypothetical protein
MCFDRLDSADLVRLHDLVLVEQEHGHPRGGDQLVDLRTPGPLRRLGVAVRGCLPDAVGLVADEPSKVFCSTL